MSEPPITDPQRLGDVSYKSPSSGAGAQETNGGPGPADDEISFLDLLIVLAKHKKLILGLPVATAIIMAIYSGFLPSIYTSTTKILPPQQSQSATSAMLAQLGGLGGLGGLASVRSTNDLYVGMLKSRTVADNLIQRFDLMKSTGAKYSSDARAGLAGATKVTAGRDGIITIEVDDPDPKRAADLANAYVEELLKLTNILAVTEAGQRRLFFERQFAQARDNLVKAEVTIRQALQQGGLIKVDDQGRAMVETTARLRGQMVVKEVQIGAMRTFATDRNPELRLAEQELESMKRQLAKIEGTGSARVEGPSGGKGLDNLRLLRDLKYHETVYELLAKQYELAKIDEAKDSAVVQILDTAIEPDRNSKPKRKQMVLISVAFALFVAILWSFIREAIIKIRSDPQQTERLQAFKRYLAWR